MCPLGSGSASGHDNRTTGTSRLNSFRYCVPTHTRQHSEKYSSQFAMLPTFTQQFLSFKFETFDIKINVEIIFRIYFS